MLYPDRLARQLESNNFTVGHPTVFLDVFSLQKSMDEICPVWNFDGYSAYDKLFYQFKKRSQECECRYKWSNFSFILSGSFGKSFELDNLP